MDSRIATLPSLTLVLPCYVDSAKQVSVSHFVLHHFCCYFMAFCSATVPNKSLILVNESVRNSSSIDGTRLNMGFITFYHNAIHHQMLILLLGFCLASYYCAYYAHLQSFFKGYCAICLRTTDFMFDNMSTI